MIRMTHTLKVAGLSLALLLPMAALPVALHAQQDTTTTAKPKAKKKARKSTGATMAPSTPDASASPAQGTTQRNPQVTDPVNPSASPEPPTPTTQGPPPPPTTPPVNTPQPPQ